MPRDAHRSLDAQLRRKVNKPLVERKRRERINKYLNELHALLTESGNTSASNKLEKADILEMAVNHIKNIKGQLALRQAERKLQTRFLPQSIPTADPLRVAIPHRPYSPACSDSSASSDYPSPPAVYQPAYPAYLPQPTCQGTVLPMKGGGYAVILHNNQLVQTSAEQTLRAAQTGARSIIRSDSAAATSVWRPW